MKKMFSIIIISLFISINAYSKGIIIGFDTSVVSIFKYSQEDRVIELAKNISGKYDRVIIHLGRKYPFTKSFFSDENAKTNLKAFCHQLKSNNIKVYMWILDSFGSENFNKLYSEHHEIIDDVVGRLDQYDIHYDGLIVDMEWINSPSGNNNQKYLEVLKYLREKLDKKELYAFASIIDNNKVNSRRGYDVRKIKRYADNVIAMLYVINSDLCMNDENRIEPCMNDSRINSLRKYFKRKNYMTAISLNQGIIIRNEEGKYVFSKPVKDEQDEIFNKLKLNERDIYRNYEVKQYNPITDFEYIDEDGRKEKLSREEDVYFIKIKNNLLREDDFIWEYSMVEDLN